MASRPVRPLVLALSVAALAAAATAASPGAARPAVAGPQEAPVFVSAAWLAARSEAPGVLVLQVESRPQRFAAGHVPGAVHVPYDVVVRGDGPGTELPEPSAFQAALERLGADDGLHLVVTGSSALAAARLWMTLDVLGLGRRVSLLDGGLDAWRDRGLPLGTGEGAVRPAGRLTARAPGGAVVDARWVQERLGAPGVALVDARPDDEYTGADGGMGGRVRPGHIPGAHQLYYQRMLREDGTLREPGELAALFAGAGVAPGDTVVTYCMVGLRASLTYAAARSLGREVRLYDGSWHDWGARADLPVVTGTEPGGKSGG